MARKLKSFDLRRLDCGQDLGHFIRNLEKKHQLYIHVTNSVKGPGHAVQKILELVDRKDLVELLEQKAKKRWGGQVIEAGLQDIEDIFDGKNPDENVLVLTFKPIQADLEAEEETRLK